MTQQELLQFVTQYYPEWSVSKQEYQPTDIGSMNANIDLFKDESGLIKDWVLGILTGSFDYAGAFSGVNEFDEEAPSNALSQKYRNNGKYATLFEGLDAGETAFDAAQTQFVDTYGLTADEVEAMNKAIMNNEALDGRFQNILKVAEAVEGEVADTADYVRRRDFAAANPAGLSDVAKEMQAAGFSTEMTPDSWFSDSIDQDRIDEAELHQQMWDLANAGFPDVSGPAASPLTQTAPASVPVPEQAGPGGQVGGPRSDGSIVVNDAFGNPVVVAKEDQAGSPWYSMEGLGGLGDAFGGAWDWITQPSGDDAEEARGGIDAQMLADASAGRSMGGMLGANTPQALPVVPSTIPSQNMQVPFNPEALYSPPPVNTLPDFNGPRGGSPRNGTPSSGGPERRPSADAARYQGMADAYAASMRGAAGPAGPGPMTPMPAGMTRDEHRASAHKAREDWAATAARLVQEERQIARARARGESIQQKQILDRLLGLPRG
jgi:hypothetical protein